MCSRVTITIFLDANKLIKVFKKFQFFQNKPPSN
jgi:hypothetical protein